MSRDKDLARIGYAGTNDLYVEFPQDGIFWRRFPGNLVSAQCTLRAELSKKLESGDREELQAEKEVIQEKIQSYASILAAYKKDLENIEEEIERGGVGKEEAEWLDALINDMVHKMSPDYVNPYNTKLGYRPTEIAIS